MQFKGYWSDALFLYRNPGVKTIEEDLLKAMLTAGVISQENYDVPQTMHFQRAARTDKGVSAAHQVVSLCVGMVIVTPKIFIT